MGLFGSVIGGLTSIIGGNAQKKAANQAAKAQAQSAQLAIGEQRRQYDTSRQDFSPYLNAGTAALQQINDLLGISTPATEGVTDWAAYVQGNPDAAANWAAIKGTKNDRFGGDINAFGQFHYEKDGSRRDLSPFTSSTAAREANQQGAIDALMASPLYGSLIRNGENAILQNGSATGALRGGDMKGALANFRADTLAQVIQQQLANLGGIASGGQGAAGSLGALGANAAGQIGNSMTQQGQALAGAALAKGGITAGQWKAGGDGLESVLSSIFGGGGIKL